MSVRPDYSPEALQAARERSANDARKLPFIAPVDAEIVEPGRTVHVWNGERFLPYLAWLPSAICAVIEPAPPQFPVDATRIVGDCREVRVLLVEDTGRWFMHVRTGKRKRAARRKDFASPSLAHAIQSAEAWYGVPAGGWRAEKQDAEKAEDLPSQVERGLDGLAVDGQ